MSGFIRSMFPRELSRDQERNSWADDLQLRKWRKGTSSVFTPRQGTFSPDDLERPY